MDFSASKVLPRKQRRLGSFAIVYFAAIFGPHKRQRKINGKGCYRSY